MDLIIDTTATDISNSAVESLTDDTPVSELKQLVVGDDEPLTVQFTNGTSAPAWASDASYQLTAALGAPTPAGLSVLASTSSFTLTGSTREGSLGMAQDALVNYCRLYLGNYPSRRSGIGLALQLRVETPTGKNITYAQLPVIVQSPVLLVAGGSSELEAPAKSPPRSWLDITGLTGGGANNLDGIATANGALPTGYVILLSYGNRQQWWKLINGSDAEDGTFVVWPDDRSISNARIWVLL